MLIYTCIDKDLYLNVGNLHLRLLQILAVDFREAGAQGPLKLWGLCPKQWSSQVGQHKRTWRGGIWFFRRKATVQVLSPSEPFSTFTKWCHGKILLPQAYHPNSNWPKQERVCGITDKESWRECSLGLVSSEVPSCHQGPRFFPTLCSAVFNGGFMLLLGAKWQQQTQGHNHT